MWTSRTAVQAFVDPLALSPRLLSISTIGMATLTKLKQIVPARQKGIAAAAPFAPPLVILAR